MKIIKNGLDQRGLVEKCKEKILAACEGKKQIKCDQCDCEFIASPKDFKFKEEDFFSKIYNLKTYCPNCGRVIIPVAKGEIFNWDYTFLLLEFKYKIIRQAFKEIKEGK